MTSCLMAREPEGEGEEAAKDSQITAEAFRSSWEKISAPSIS
jgi:hypothetical protein